MGMETIIWGTVLVLIGIPFYFYEKRNWFKAMTGKD
ncbi:hypothetical protein ND16A_3693 [Thalassotalea sp. ND16A]|nr:hypothetical protein ND16A_3693 [Thalassotalea sp. ND16A]